jgi:VanZ family protein
MPAKSKLLSVILRTGFVACIIALPLLAWLPANVMTRTSLGGHAEHLIAYLGTTILMGLTFRKSPGLGMQCGLLIAYAALLEAGQLYAPGRQASLQDLAFSSAGIAIGGLFFWATHIRAAHW